ncbi:MAG: RluA family pseudouridine synthase [Candidatus Omnitrophica bacterium]|nr:RluA family pseudouridine synthase [Candidatus Omnitrophota bacterium]MDD5488366.1 RluA family pseudouridine synthase [Candidatus Omnitrophota bacterium]
MDNTREHVLVVGEEVKSVRVDKYIVECLGEDLSRTAVKELMDTGGILLDGKPVKPSHILRPGERISVMIPPCRAASDIEPEDMDLKILFEDEYIIVVDKPAGMVVHPGCGNIKGTMVAALLYHCGKLADAEDMTRPGIVHRLDKDTSGVIVVAKTDKAMRSLAKQFQNRTVTKRYLAFVKGRVELDNGVVDVPIARHRSDRKKMDAEYENGKASRTVYHVRKRYNGFTILDLDLETGRTHQIRVHMKHIGHPVLGDMVYGPDRSMGRQALHAEYISFTHPYTGKKMEFTSPMPEDMAEYLEKAEST